MIITSLALVSLLAQQPVLNLHPISSGAMKKIGFYVPNKLELSTTLIKGLTNCPANAALFGKWSFGGKEYSVVELRDDTGMPSEIDFDFSGTGDLSKATKAVYKANKNDPKNPDKVSFYSTDFTVPSPIAKGGVTVNFYRFNPKDEQRSALQNSVFYYGDYALDGTVTLGGTGYHAMLIDALCQGTYAGANSKEMGNIGPYSLLVDRDGDGKFRTNYEAFLVGKPFNIGGKSYVVSGLDAAGTGAKIGISSTKVAEIPVPPTLAPGRKVKPFTAVDRQGKTVHFPEDFKGRIVMLDFWATWCGPCMGEVPNVVKVYNQTHASGFEILGISLDNAETLAKIDPVTKQNGMTWDQIADGKYWDAAIAKMYGIQAIPAAYIVDGNTGMILAEGENIRGEKLLPAVQKALEKLKPGSK